MTLQDIITEHNLDTNNNRIPNSLIHMVLWDAKARVAVSITRDMLDNLESPIVMAQHETRNKGTERQYTYKRFEAIN